MQFLNNIFTAIITGLLLSTYTLANRLTYELKEYENYCLHAFTINQITKMGFFFAVFKGGEYIVNFEVLGPGKKSLFQGDGLRQGDYVFSANQPGEYSFCFYNPETESKLVDVYISVQGDPGIESPLKFKDPKHITNMERAADAIQNQATNLIRYQRAFRAEENRNTENLMSISRQVHSYLFFVCAIVVTMAGVQVLAIRSFFGSNHRKA